MKFMLFAKNSKFAKYTYNLCWDFCKFGGENMEKVKAFLSNPWVTLVIGFILGALHNWFNL